MGFYDNFIKLCKERDVYPSHVALAIGLTSASPTYWKRGAVPKASTVQKLADYFGVTVDYLLGNTESPLIFRPSHAAPIAFDEKKIMESAGIDILSEIDIGFYEAYSKLSEEDKETVRQMVEFMRERRKDKK